MDRKIKAFGLGLKGAIQDLYAHRLHSFQRLMLLATDVLAKFVFASFKRPLTLGNEPNDIQEPNLQQVRINAVLIVYTYFKALARWREYICERRLANKANATRSTNDGP